MSGEKPRGQEVSLQNDLEEDRVEASFLMGEPTPESHKGLFRTEKDQ